MGVIRACKAPVMEDVLHKQIAQIRSTSRITTVDELFISGNVVRYDE
jgi:hypothetical protein